MNNSRKRKSLSTKIKCVHIGQSAFHCGRRHCFLSWVKMLMLTIFTVLKSTMLLKQCWISFSNSLEKSWIALNIKCPGVYGPVPSFMEMIGQGYFWPLTCVDDPWWSLSMYNTRYWLLRGSVLSWVALNHRRLIANVSIYLGPVRHQERFWTFPCGTWWFKAGGRDLRPQDAICWGLFIYFENTIVTHWLLCINFYHILCLFYWL